jgi:glycerophosphoryl diester phosphodiesterase
MGWWSRSFGFNFGAYQALHAKLHDVTAHQVARVHRLKRRIHVWTVDSAEDMRRLFAWDVDGIITRDPKLALDVLSETK